MRFCPVCERAMERDASSGAIVFGCKCGAEEPGGPDDVRVGGAVLGAAETTEMYERLIREAPFDRANVRVRRDCPDCGVDFMSLVRIGEAETIIYRCACGREERGGVGAAGAVPADEEKR